MNKKIVLCLVVLALSIVGAEFYFTPHLAIYKMKKAIEHRDIDALSGYVDYPSLRKSLQANINTLAAGNNTNRANRRSGFMRTISSSGLIGPMVDGLITPEGFAMFLRNGLINHEGLTMLMNGVFINPEGLTVLMKGQKPGSHRSEIGLAKEAESEDKGSKVAMSISYKGFNRFVMRIKEKGTSGDPVELIFKRNGLVLWKLCGVNLPKNLFEPQKNRL